MKVKTILDLCAGSGNWSKPYLEAGYNVIRVDLPQDLRFFPWPGQDIHGILIASPCTYLCSSGARWKRTKAQMLEAVGIPDAGLRLVALCQPKWWALEQPIGKLPQWYGPPRMYFHPYEYGDPYTKRTALWGNFNIPKKRPVKPTEGGKIWKMGPSPDRAAKRSLTPPGFAKAFFEANR